MAQLLTGFGAIVTHTPAWVFFLILVLLAIGIQAMRTRSVAPRRLLITPAVFVAWGVVSLAAKPHFSAMLAGDWIAAALLGLGFGWTTTRLAGLRADRERKRAYLPGSPALLARVVTVFLVKYALNATMAMRPDLLDRLAPWDAAVSGLMAGYFVGWLLRFWSRYRVAPALEPRSPDLATAALGSA